MDCNPPFKITPAIISRIAEISEIVGRLSAFEEIAKNIRLRRIDRIRTIHGSLAIEGNTLSIEQITAILEGKRVIASPREIQEVRNAIAAYDRFAQWDPGSEKDLLNAHRVMMTGLLDNPGNYRKGGVGVLAGEVVVHMAPPADRVPFLMHDLLQWLKATDQHPLIIGSVFHYEFEFIHPFDDGNGRMGRLWQALILTKWNPLLAHVPVESFVHDHQSEYYSALNKSTENAESSVFIEFMLNMILDAIKSQPAPEVTPEVKKMLSIMKGEMTRKEIQKKLRLKDEKHFREAYQQPAVGAGLIEMTIPDKPNSRLQRYRITPKGNALIITNK
jgi:Fic family protein